MGRQALKRKHKGDKPMKEKYRTKRKTKDLDEIHEDMKPGNAEKLVNQEIDHEKAGLGQHYCLQCTRYFVSEVVLKQHFKSKPHRRRMKHLQIEPYTIEEAERAAGAGSYVRPKPVSVDINVGRKNMDMTD